MSDITSMAAARAWLAKGRDKTDRPAPHGNARRIVADFDGPDSVSIVYHKTPVVTFRPDGTIALWGNGYATKTTAQVMDEVTFPAAGVRVSIRSGDSHGQGDGFLFHGAYDDREHWPSTAPRVQRCRACRGTGDSRWDGEKCWRCKGAGEVDYGSKPIPVEANASSLVIIDPLKVGPAKVIPAGVGALPTYDCRCKLCVEGYATWQDRAWAR